jgi:hypothetical protein
MIVVTLHLDGRENDNMPIPGALSREKCEVDSGTLCRTASPLPGPAGVEARCDLDSSQLIRCYPELWESILSGFSATVISNYSTQQMLARAEHPLELRDKLALIKDGQDYLRAVESLKRYYADMCWAEYERINSSLKGFFRTMAKEKKFDDEHAYYAWLRVFYYRWGIRDPVAELNSTVVAGRFLGRTYFAHQVLVDALKQVEGEFDSSDPDMGDFGAFCPRPTNDHKALSQHALGRAIDFSPETNPQLAGESARVIDEILAFLQQRGLGPGGRVSSKRESLCDMPDEAVKDRYLKMKAMSDSLQSFLGTWLSNWEQLRGKKEQYEKLVAGLARNKKADPIDVDRGREEIYEIGKELEREEYQLVAKLVATMGSKGARLIRDKGIITLDLRLFDAMHRAHFVSGIEWREQKDTMHFEIPLPSNRAAESRTGRRP